MNQHYVIGYYLTNEAKDGKRRVVRIEPKRKSNFGIWSENRISRRAHNRKIL